MKNLYHNLIIDHLNRLTTLANTYTQQGNTEKADEIHAAIAKYNNVSPHDKVLQQEAVAALSSIL